MNKIKSSTHLCKFVVVFISSFLKEKKDREYMG